METRGLHQSSELWRRIFTRLFHYELLPREYSARSVREILMRTVTVTSIIDCIAGYGSSIDASIDDDISYRNSRGSQRHHSRYRARSAC